jgi:outer membrane protein assembly factor BamE (lipoprotein component of BamABCDE complex)
MIERSIKYWLGLIRMRRPRLGKIAGKIIQAGAGVFCAGALLCSAACVSTGARAITDPGVVARIEAGKTTKQEVTGLLGLPVAVYFPTDDEEEWNYPYLTVYPWAPDFIPVADAYASPRYHTRVLSVFFSKNGMVKKLETADKCCTRETVPRSF